jgi:3-phenylpropionate/trans-cinnamate dioxygenase ferredoxin component
MTDYQTVLRTPELGPGSLVEVEAHGHAVALANVGQTYYALDARCPNDGTNLAREGRLEGDLLICPRDAAAFDVRSGDRVNGGNGQTLQSYAIQVAGNEIKVGPPLD